MRNLIKPYFPEIFLLILASIYYLLFINKGLIFTDEGYYIYASEQIVHGAIPYKDIFLLHAPLYFYILAVLFKIFGPLVIVGRILNYIICLGILVAALAFLRQVKASYFIKIISTLCVLSFGLPLINIPVPVWLCVFFVPIITIFYHKWAKNSHKSKSELLIISTLLGLAFATKQNIGVALIFITNFFIYFSTKKSWIKNFLYLNLPWIFMSGFWFLIFFAPNFSLLKDFIALNINYSKQYHFTYPGVSVLLSKFGLIKLIPYYVPVLMAIIVFWKMFKRKFSEVILFAALSVGGFALTVYPASDLIHVYPFLGFILISFILIFSKTKYSIYSTCLVIVCIGIGFYLSLFREVYRYDPPYRFQNTTLNIDRAKYIKVDPNLASQLNKINKFISQNTHENNKIFVYPVSPMINFLFNREAPSKYITFNPEFLSVSQENEVISELKSKKIRFIITDGEYRFDTPTSKFVQNQKLILSDGRFKVFRIVSN